MWYGVGRFLIGITSGMAPLIRAVLSNLIGEEAAKTIHIISNEAEVKPDGKWELKFRHPNRYLAPFPTVCPASMNLLMVAWTVVTGTTSLRQFCRIGTFPIDLRSSFLVTVFRVRNAN